MLICPGKVCGSPPPFLESVMLDPNSLNVHVQYQLSILAEKIAHDSADHKY